MNHLTAVAWVSLISFLWTAAGTAQTPQVSSAISPSRQYQRRFATLAKAQAAYDSGAIRNGDVVFVEGYGSSGDGGAMHLMALPSGSGEAHPDAPNLSIREASFRFEMFGAVGDFDPTGVLPNGTDDRDAVQETVDYLASRGGGAVIATAGKAFRIDSSISISNAHGIHVGGDGTLFRYTPTTATNVLTIEDCSSIVVSDLSISSNYSGADSGSTGSNPLIEIRTSATGSNEDLVIRDVSLSGGNIASVLVDGRYRTDGSISNKNVWIRGCTMSGASTGVFIYKGADGTWIEDNRLLGCGSGGIALDTRAESDADPQNYVIRNSFIRGNTITDTSAVGAFAARGVTLKGGVSNCVVSDNYIDGVESASVVETYGILIVPDAGGQSGRSIVVRNNTVEDVNPAGTGGWALSLGRGFDNVQIAGNSFSGCQRGCRLENDSQWSFTDNWLEDLATAAESPIWIAAGDPTTRGKRISGNTVVRGIGASSTAVAILAGASDIHLGCGRYEGFGTIVFVPPAGVPNMTHDSRSLGRGTLVVPVTSFGAGELKLLGTVSVDGARFGDYVSESVVPLADSRYFGLSAEVTSIGVVSVYARNEFVSVSTGLPAALDWDDMATIEVQVSRPCLE